MSDFRLARALWLILITLSSTQGSLLGMAQAKERVAILELKNQAGIKNAEAGYLSDVVRDVASELPTQRFSVMTRDNIMVLLPPGVSLEDCVGSCAIETGRNIGAHWIIVGGVVRFGRSLRVTLKLHHTQTGELRGSVRIKGDTVEALESPLSRATSLLLAKLKKTSRGVTRTTSRKSYAERITQLKDGGFDQSRGEAPHPLAEHRIRLNARLKAKHDLRVGKAWRATRSVIDRGDEVAQRALQLFLAEFESHPLGNPYAAEAKRRFKEARTHYEQRGTGLVRPGITWVKIPGGVFRMGSKGDDRSEKPIHQVRVKSFLMAETEVTVGQYRTCVNAGVCSEPDLCRWGKPNWTKFPKDHEHHPINCVDWGQARTFSRWVGGELPTEAQWEYAARGGQTFHYAGSDTPDDIGWYTSNSGQKTHSVKGKVRNDYRLYDMSGNVWEWTLDEWHQDYTGAPDRGERPWGHVPRCGKVCSHGSVKRVSRGGGWYGSAAYLRVANRDHVDPANRFGNLGFRPCKPVP